VATVQRKRTTLRTYTNSSINRQKCYSVSVVCLFLLQSNILHRCFREACLEESVRTSVSRLTTQCSTMSRRLASNALHGISSSCRLEEWRQLCSSTSCHPPPSRIASFTALPGHSARAQIPRKQGLSLRRWQTTRAVPECVQDPTGVDDQPAN
jgi:hypothetical protein